MDHAKVVCVFSLMWLLSSFVLACSDATPAVVPSADADAASDITVTTDSAVDWASSDANTGLGPPDTDTDSTPDTASDVAIAGSWAEAAAVPGGELQEHSVVAVAGKIYCLGGFRGFASTDEVLIYDIASDSWSSGAPLPQAGHHLNVAVVDGDIVVLGALGGGFSEFPATWLYDVSADSWDTQTLTPAPAGQERGSSAVGVIDGVVYIAGGLRGGSAVTLASTYDVANGAWATLDPLPAKRDHLVGAAHGGRFYAVGGRTGTISGVKGEVFEYDPAGAGGWLSKSPLPTPRGGIAGATLNSVLYVFGGEGSAEPGGLFSQVEAYDFAADSWTVLAPMPTPVHGTGAASWNGKIYIPGGGIVAAFGASDIFQVYSP